MSWSQTLNFVGFISSIITIFSIMINIYQYIKKKNENKTMRNLLHTQYNHFYSIARICNRVRIIEEDENQTADDKLAKIMIELGAIRGVTDASRTGIITYSRENLDFIPYYEHPAYPGRRDFTDDVLMGIPPDKIKS